MTQLRLPLFSTGIPQVIPAASLLTVLDLRGDRTNSIARLVTVWVNYSAIVPTSGVRQELRAYIQQGVNTPVLVSRVDVDQRGGPYKLLENYVLRGDVQLLLEADSVDLEAGAYGVAWGYYSIEGETPRTAATLRPLEPVAGVVPESCGLSSLISVFALTTFTIHIVSADQIDEVRVESYIPTITGAGLHFAGTPIVAPVTLGPGFITMVDIIPPQEENRPLFRRYLDGIPFRGAGALQITTQASAFYTGSFARN